MNARIVSKIFLFVSLAAASVSSWAGPVPPAGLTPDDVILNKGAVQNGKTFDVPGATITTLTSNIIRAQTILVNGVPVSTQPATGNNVTVYPASSTIIAPQGIVGTFGTFTGIINGTTVTLTGIFNGATIHGSSMVITGTITGGNLHGTNTGDASIGTANGLSLSGQAFSMTTASTISTGTLRAFDFALFNNKLSPTGNGSALTGLTKTQVGLGNVLNLDQTDASNLSSGLVDPTLLGNGTTDSTTYLRGDSFFATLNSTAVGLGQVTNNRQVKVADYTQKGALLVGISTGVFTVLPPGNDGSIMQTDASQPTGYKFVPTPSSFTVYPASSTASFPKGGVASTWTVTGVTTLLGLTNGTTVHFSSGSYSGPLDASNLRGTNTGDVALGTANGLTLTSQLLSMSTASATQTGALTAADWTRFNNESTGTGHFNDVYVSSSLTWPDSYVQRVHGPVFNVKDYGAKGDGTTDDYAAVQATLNAAHAANGGIVFGPTGTYLIGSTLIIYSSTTFSGAGIGATTWKSKPNANVRLINISAPGYNINLVDATFDMNGSTQSGSTAITIGGVHGHIVKNVRMINPYDSLYLLTGSPDPTNNDNAVYEDVIFDGTGQNQATDVVDLGSATNVRVTRMRSFNCKPNTGNGLVVFGITQNLTITDSLFDANGNGTPVVLVGINGGKMDGCELRGGYEAGVRVTYWNEISPSYPMKNFQIVNNNIHDNAYDGIWMNHAGISPLRPENIVIANNAIWNNQQSGFRCIVSSGVIFTGNYVFNNSLAGAGSYYAMNFASGFAEPGEIGYVRVSNNRFYDNQATPTQTKLYNLSYVNQFVSAGNFISQITVSSTVANSTNVQFLDLNPLPIASGGTNSAAALAGSKTVRTNSTSIVEDVVTSDGSGNLGNVASLTSQTGTPATTGVVRLGSSEVIAWRSNGGGGNLSLSKNSSDDLQYNSSTLIKGAGSGLSKTGDTLALATLTAARAMMTDTNGIASTSTVTSTELGYVSGVTSALQTQLNAKAPLASPTFSGTITTPLTTSKALQTGSASELQTSVTTSSELAFLSGVTSNVQTQFGLKAPLASPTFTGTVTLPVTASRALVSDGSSAAAVSVVTSTELANLSGIRSNVQTQINSNTTNIALSTTTTRVHVAQFTYGLTTASGTQSITGVGFKPTAVTFIAAKDGGLQGSNGMDDGTTHACYSLITGSLNWWPSDSIVAYDGGVGNTQNGHITSMDTDGFTITWVKAGSPTGTYNIVYTASR